MKKSSVGLQVFAYIGFISGLLIVSIGLAELFIAWRWGLGAWMTSVGALIAFIFAIFVSNLERTEEEGRLPEKPKEVQSQGGHDCCDSESG